MVVATSKLNNCHYLLFHRLMAILLAAKEGDNLRKILSPHLGELKCLLLRVQECDAVVHVSNMHVEEQH